uniref:Uncharacterized protein n=1 Tax=Aegilops tauschii subsp. strangulata TaxID=200361 RepID=A0A453A1A0_AEGTS
PRQSARAVTFSGTAPASPVAKRLGDAEAFLGSAAATRLSLARYWLLSSYSPLSPHTDHGSPATRPLGASSGTARMRTDKATW